MASMGKPCVTVEKTPAGVVGVQGILETRGDADKVFRLVTSYDKYPKLKGPRLLECVVTDTVDDSTVVLHQKHKINFFGNWFSGTYQSVYHAEQDANARRLWLRMQTSDLMKVHEIDIQVLPLGEDVCRVVYKNMFVPHKLPPHPFRQRLYSQATTDLVQILDNLQKEVTVEA